MSSRHDTISHLQTGIDVAMSAGQFGRVRRSKSFGPGIASRLKLAQKDHDLTVADIAKRALTSRQTVHALLLGGGGTSSVDLLADVAKGLGVSPSWLAYGDGPQTEPESPRAAILEAFKALPAAERRKLLRDLCDDKPTKD